MIRLLEILYLGVCILLIIKFYRACTALEMMAKTLEQARHYLEREAKKD